jgi:hypothetical protein
VRDTKYSSKTIYTYTYTYTAAAAATTPADVLNRRRLRVPAIQMGARSLRR